MMSIVSRAGRVVSGTAIMSGATFFAFDEQGKRKAAATYRIVNLLSTVGMMCADYGVDIMFNKKSSGDKYELKHKELCKLQSDLEGYHEEQLIMETKNKELGIHQAVDPWMEKINANKVVMDKVAEELVELSAEQHIDHDLHKRNAQRLTQMCAKNGGLYIKLGQHIAMLDYIVPLEYQTELFSLLGTTPESSYASVREVIRSELGAYPEEIFDSFETKPIASASLAQVHVATKNGVKFAVKVQHAGLAESSHTDMAVITALVSIIPKLFKDFNYDWLSAEMNRNIPLELDFRIERGNILQTTAYLAKFIASGDVAVPTVQDQWSARRVLTMSFEEGCYVSNQAQIGEWGLSKAHIAKTISTVFWEQIFAHGFVHCDPHEANMLVRPNPRNPLRPQVVLLDHGLYRQLNDTFREDYCRLWQGIVTGNKAQIERYCKEMNAGAAYPLLASMITQRSWDDVVSEDIDRLRTKGRQADSAILKAYVEKYFVQIMQLLGVVPSDLLLLFKTSDCLRHLDLLLGSDLNTSVVAASVVSEVLLTEDLAASYAMWSQSWLNSVALFVSAYTDYYNVQTRLVGYYLLGWVQYANSFVYVQ